MARKPGRDRRKRRSFIKELGVGVAGASALAGCSGTGGGGNQQTSESTGTVTGGASQKPYKGITVEHWNLRHQESEAASEAIKQAVSDYESETGATIEVNYSTFDAASGTKWINNMKRGERPVFADTPAGNLGLMVTEEMARPYSEYKQYLSEEVRSGIEWFQSQAPDLFFSHSFYGGGENTYTTPISASPPDSFLVRTDHYEEAGLSIKDDFPPTNYEELKEQAVTLTKDGPADYGFQVYGGLGDVTDAGPATWAAAMGGWEGEVVKRDWSDTIIDNDVWKETFRQWSSFNLEHGTSNPGTITASEEDATQLLANGNVSMSSVPPQNHSMLVDQASSQLDEGLIRWGPAWKGESGARGSLGTKSLMFISKPDNVDEDTWAKKTEVAADFVSKTFLSEDFQKNTYRTIGNYTIRDDISAEDIIQAQDNPDSMQNHNLINTMETGIFDQDKKFGGTNFPQESQIVYDIMAQEAQRAVKGDKSADQAMNDAAQTVRDQIDFSQYS